MGHTLNYNSAGQGTGRYSDFRAGEKFSKLVRKNKEPNLPINMGFLTLGKIRVEPCGDMDKAQHRGHPSESSWALGRDSRGFSCRDNTVAHIIRTGWSAAAPCSQT